MPSRKVLNRTKNHESLRFTAGDIVRAIEGVRAAGLQVYSVEVTPTGAINISTQPPPKIGKLPPARQALPETQTSTSSLDETRSVKKQA